MHLLRESRNNNTGSNNLLRMSVEGNTNLVGQTQNYTRFVEVFVRMRQLIKLNAIVCLYTDGVWWRP